MMFDVAVIGGGPAGSTAAILLAKAGRKVVLIERDEFPRFHIGESLLPFSMDTLDRLGVLDKMGSAGFLPKHGAWVISGCGKREVKFYFKNGFGLAKNSRTPKHTTAFQVTRAEFDHLLLERARECGAAVRTRAEVTEVREQPDRISMDIRDVDGKTTSLEAAFVIDCSGRHSLLGTRHGLKRPYPGLRKFALYAHWEGVALPEGPDGTLTRMIREPDGWFWVIPLSRTKASIGWVTDLDAFRADGKKPAQVLSERIAAQPAVANILRDARQTIDVHSSGDYSFRNTRMAGPRWLLAGDAAGFIDPVFSSGVFLALFSGENAARAIDGAIARPSSRAGAFRDYEKNLARVMDLYHTFVRGWYRPEFIETILNPQEFFEVVPAVNSVLAGNPGRDFSILWRLWIFRALVALQKHVPLSPRLGLSPRGAPCAA